MIETKIRQENQRYHAFFIENNNGFFLQDNGQVIDKYDLSKGYIESFCLAGEENLERYQDICFYQESLLCIPENTCNILVYHLDTKCKRYVMLDDRYFLNKDKPLFVSFVLENDRLYLIPNRYRAIVVLDLIKNEVKYIDSWYEEFNIHDGDVFFTANVVNKEKIIFWGSSQANQLFIFDKIQFRVKTINLGNHNYVYDCIAVVEDDVWMVGTKDKIMHYNLSSGKIDEYDYPKGYQVNKAGRNYNRIVMSKNKVTFIPYCANMLLSIESIDGQSKIKSKRVDYQQKYNLLTCQKRNKYYIFCNADRNIYQGDCITKIKSVQIGDMQDFLQELVSK